MRVADALALYASCGAVVLLMGAAALLRVLPAVRPPTARLVAGLVSWAGLLLAAAWLAPLRNGDEAANSADAILLALSGRLPHYTHPLLSAQLGAGLWALWLQAAGLASQLPEQALQALAAALRLARLPAVVGSLLLVGVTGRWAAQLRGPRAGWLAGLLVVLGPAADLHSAVSPHPLSVGLGALAIWLAAGRSVPAPAWQVGLAGGLAASAHGFGLVHAGLAAGLLLWRSRRHGDAVQLLAAAAAAVALIHPSAWLDRDAVVAMFRYRALEVTQPEFAHIAHNGPDYYLIQLAKSPLILAAALLAPPAASRWLWRALALGWVVLLSLFATRFSRYLLHAWPWLALLAACGLDALLDRLGQWGSTRRAAWGRAAQGLVVLVLLLAAAHGPVRRAASQHDARSDLAVLQALRGQAVHLQTDCLGSLSVAPRAGLLPDDWPLRTQAAAHAVLGTLPAQPGTTAPQIRARCDARSPEPGWQILYRAGALEVAVSWGR